MAKETLNRFIDAQNYGQDGSTFPTALAEIQQNGKTSHWMWYIFPQLTGINPTPSSTSIKFAIQSFDEAKLYLKQEMLRKNLMAITQATQSSLTKGITAEALFGQEDSSKFHTSLTLFLLAAHENHDSEAYGLFNQTLRLAFPENTLHARTLELLKAEQNYPSCLALYKSIDNMPVSLVAAIKTPSPIPTTAAPKTPSEGRKAAVPKAFAFSRTERFFQWLYNLTHSKKNQFKKQDISTLKSARSALWKWLMGLGKLSNHLKAQKKTPLSNEKIISTAGNSNLPRPPATIQFDGPGPAAQKVTETIAPNSDKKPR